MKQLSNQLMVLMLAGLLGACGGGGGSGVSLNAEPDKPTHPEAEVAAVTALQVAETRVDAIMLRWQYQGDAEQFEILRDGDRIATISADLLSYQDANLAPQRRYEYQVVALNASGQRSAAVAIAAMTFNNQTPVMDSAPEFLTLTTAQSLNSVLQSFSASDGDGHTLSWRVAARSGSQDALPVTINNSGELLLSRSVNGLGGKVFSLMVEVSDGYSVASRGLSLGFIELGNQSNQLGLMREVYTGHAFSTDIESLLTFEQFPDQPSDSGSVTDFKAPSNGANNYGQRLSGYLVPPVSGEYTFWIASDDGSQLHLSSDLSRDNLRQIAQVSGWVGEDNWDGRAEQQSQAVTLQAGVPYRIEALMVEYGGGDHLSVAWQRPGGSRELIASQYLRLPLDRQPPQAISDLKVVKTSESAVILEWTEATDNIAVVGYEVWNNGVLLSAVDAAELSETNLEMTNLDSGRRYDFSLVAFDQAGNRSAASNMASVMISDYLAPAAPANLNISNVGPYSAELRWQSAEANSLFRIELDGRVLATTTDTAYTLRQLQPATNYQLRVVSVDAAGNVSERGAELTFRSATLDTSRPYFKADHYLAAVASNAGFGQRIFQAQALIDGDAAISYQLAGDNVGTFALSASGELTLAGSLNGVQQQTLTIQASDGQQNAQMQLTVLVVDAQRFGQRGVNQQLWTGIGGNQVADIPLDSMPNAQALLTQFASQPALGNNYGQRLRGFLRVPVSGQYNFWIASDDHSELRLSADMDSAKAELIARVNGYTAQNGWYDSNRVKTDIELVAGQLYYIEALHKEGGGGDHLSVAWSGPNNGKALLSGDDLLPFSALYPSAPLVNQLVQSGFDQNGEQLTLNLSIADDAAGLPVFIYYGTVDAGDQVGGWQNMIAAGNLSSGEQQVILPNVTPGESYFVRVEVRGPAGSSWSSVIPVTTEIIPAGKQAGEALPQTLSLTVEVDQQQKALNFYKHSVRSPNYQLLTFDDRRQQQYQAVVPMPEPRTYRGVVSNDPYLVVTGVIDADGQMHISAWRGDGRAWGKVVDVSDRIDANKLGNSESRNDEMMISVDVPAIENNRYFVPQPGVDFHNNLARVSFKHEYTQFVNQARGSIINSIAQMENHINETDYVWAQKTGLRWDVGRALIEVHGNSTADNNQPRPAATDATNFTIEFQDPVNGGYCWGGGDWVGCVANFTHNWGFTHEIGHNMGLGHGEQTDNNNQIQAPGTQLGNMQARKTTRRLQARSKFKPAQALTDAMPPAAFKDYLTVYQNETADVAVLANDYDANGETLSIAEFQSTTAQGGQVVQQGNRLRYTPPTDYIGVDQFTYTVSDGSLRTVGPVQIQVLSNGISGDWDMETVSADHVVNDASGAGNHLTAPELSGLSDGAALADIREASNSNHAMTLQLMASAEKANDALGHSLLPHKLDPGHKSFSASVWIKYAPGDAARLLMGKSSSGPNNMEYGGWEIRSQGSTLAMQVNFRDRLMVNNQAVISQQNALTAGVWHHLVMVVDRDNQQLRGYLNGVAMADPVTLPQGSGPIMAAMNSSGYGGGSPFRVGGHAQLSCSGEGDEQVCTLSPGQAFDDVKVYHRALSEAEIQTLSAR